MPILISKSTIRATLLSMLFALPLAAAAQGGGAAGGGGAGAGAGSGTGAGSASSGAAGAAAHGAPAPGQAAPAPGTPQGQQSAAAAYAAAASTITDPRKPAPSRPGAFTLRQVIEQTRAANPTLLAAELNLRAVRAQEIQAAVRANPYLGVAGQDLTLPLDGSEGNPPSETIQISRLFERGNKRLYRVQNAQATTTQTRAQLEDTTRQTILTVKTAFVHMLFAKQSLELSKANLADFRHEVEIANDRFKAGDIGKLDFERLDLQLGSFESDSANDEIALLQASSQLQTLMGIAVPSPAFDIAGEIIPPTLTQTQAELTASALVNRPDLLAAQAAILAAEANARLAISNGTADPTLEAEYEQSGLYPTFGVSVNIPLRLFDRNQGNKATARLQADANRYTAAAARNQVASDVDQAWTGYTRAKALSDRFGNHYLDESIDVLGISRFAYDHGGLALIDYLDALRDARTSTSDALNAYAQTWLALHQLSAAAAQELTP